MDNCPQLCVCEKVSLDNNNEVAFEDDENSSNNSTSYHVRDIREY